MGNHLTPIEVCERLIGRPEVISRICEINEKSAYQWRGARGPRAAGDLPLTAYIRRLLAHSAAHGLGLTADHLIWGASEAEVADILSLRQVKAEAA